MPQDDLSTLWFPVAASADLPLRHVYQGQLLGQELAVWRADDGMVNVWENRCLHRGVRLSIGLNLGNELKCQYHGWRYASGTASCLYIPAHPANAPPRTIRNRVYPALERYGLVWSSIDPHTDAPVFPELATRQALVLRPVPVRAPAPLVLEALASHKFLPTGEIGSASEGLKGEASPLAELALALTCSKGASASSAVFFVQPTAAATSVIRGVLQGEVALSRRIEALRHHDRALQVLRDAVEEEARELPPGSRHVIAEVAIPPSPRVTTISGAERTWRGEAIRVRVVRKWLAAADVAALQLEPLAGPLPAAKPGAHIDVHLPNGLVRQYSLVNGPTERDAYVIGVKREPASRGGSATVHDVVREGDLLAVSAPHDNFPLARRAHSHILIAGGIGLTPLLAMAKTLSAADEPFRLHVFARSEAHVAFAPDIEALGAAAERHVGLDPEATRTLLGGLLAGRQHETHVYICGPAPMLEAARQAAEEAGWPESAVHFEYFANENARDDSSSFEVALARSAITVTVPAGRTIVDVLREHGVNVPTSCEQGACGTCLTTVIEGEPDHQDVFLSKTERASGTCMMPCISRSNSPRLVLDL